MCPPQVDFIMSLCDWNSDTFSPVVGLTGNLNPGRVNKASF